MGADVPTRPLQDARDRDARMESSPPVGPGEWPLCCPDRGCHRPWGFVERGLTKEMGHNGTERNRGTCSQIKWKLVDVLHQHIGPLGLDRPMHRAAPLQGKAVSAAESLDRDAIDDGPSRCPAPAGTDQANPMPSNDQTAEDFEQMDLRAPSMRIGPVLPVNQKDVHRGRKLAA